VSPARRTFERVWYGDSAIDRAARGALLPATMLYAAVTDLRNALYDRGLLAIHPSPIPALALGNLSVGGTGKTPVAAWAAAQLRARGGRPAVVLRGYGGDEPLVHERLNPAMPVVADADRVRGVQTAVCEGADCVVLDDAFQHRRIARVADWVLVSAERWHDGQHRLPSGPLRETERALGRATLVIVTRKTASLGDAEQVMERLAQRVPGGAAAVMHLAPDGLATLTGDVQPLGALAGTRVLAVAAIGEPAAFHAQLRALGATVEEATFADHHAFTSSDVATLARRAERVERVVCTLKDAVKLGPLWRGAAPPLWYVSQAAAVDRGGVHLDASLEAVLAARMHHN